MEEIQKMGGVANSNGENRSRYSPFMLVMLILSSIYTGFVSILMLVDLIEPDAFGNENLAMLLFGLSINLGSIACLALLYMKNKIGIILKFTLLAATMVYVVTNLSLLGHNTGMDFNSLSSQFAKTRLLISIIAFVFLAGIGALWFFAWRSQEKLDGIGKFLGKASK